MIAVLVDERVLEAEVLLVVEQTVVAADHVEHVCAVVAILHGEREVALGLRVDVVDDESTRAQLDGRRRRRRNARRLGAQQGATDTAAAAVACAVPDGARSTGAAVGAQLEGR